MPFNWMIHIPYAGFLRSSPVLHPLNDMATLQVTFNLHLSRKSAYYGLNILAPCIMIVALALLMFWLPADSGEKVSLGITILLAFSVFQLVLADRSPTTSDFFPVLCEYSLIIYSNIWNFGKGKDEIQVVLFSSLLEIIANSDRRHGFEFYCNQEDLLVRGANSLK